MEVSIKISNVLQARRMAIWQLIIPLGLTLENSHRSDGAPCRAFIFRSKQDKAEAVYLIVNQFSQN